MVKRNMIHTKRMPEMLSDVTVQPIMFVLLFAFVFGASIATGGGASYREFLLPGIQAQTIVFTAFVVASGITADVEKGIIDRFRSLPISRSSVLIGRSVASLLHSTIGVVVMAVTGLAIGWRIRGSGRCTRGPTGRRRSRDRPLQTNRARGCLVRELIRSHNRRADNRRQQRAEYDQFTCLFQPLHVFSITLLYRRTKYWTDQRPRRAARRTTRWL